MGINFQSDRISELRSRKAFIRIIPFGIPLGRCPITVKVHLSARELHNLAGLSLGAGSLGSSPGSHTRSYLENEDFVEVRLGRRGCGGGWYHHVGSHRRRARPSSFTLNLFILHYF